MYANATDAELNKHLVISAFSSSSGFADGGNLATQIINNGPRSIDLPLQLRGVTGVTDYVSYLLDNEHNLEAVHDLISMSNGTIIVSIPAKAVVVVSIRY